MQIHNNLHSAQLGFAQAEAKSASVAVAELAGARDTETVGNGNFPAIAKAGEAEKSKSQDSQKTAGQTEYKSERAQDSQEKQKLEQQRQEVAQLAARDREVRAHEQAHMAVGGRYAGGASYQYERGPDGVSYAVSGEVPISTGKETSPQATIIKAQIIRRAALAPAEPSPQDRRVAARAGGLEAEARKELIAEQQQESEKLKAARETEDKPGTEVKKSEGDKNIEPRKEAPDGISDNSHNSISSQFSRLPGSTGGKLLQSISNTTLGSLHPGSILDQIA